MDDGLWQACAVVVLAGGTSSRMGGALSGVDKTALPLAGRPAIVRLLAGVPDEVPVTVVAAPDHAVFALLEGRPLVAAREDPPGGGPVAGLAAGLAALRGTTGAGGGEVESVLALAGDLPLAGPVLPRLLARLAGSGAVAVLGEDPSGRRQPLLAAYRRGPLAEALAAEPAAGRSLRAVLAALEHATPTDATPTDATPTDATPTDATPTDAPAQRTGVLTEPVSAAEALDVDTEDDVARVLRILAGPVAHASSGGTAPDGHRDAR